MNAQPVEDSKVWRRRAAEARGAAQQMDDPETKRILEEIAKSYDRIAALVNCAKERMQRRRMRTGPNGAVVAPAHTTPRMACASEDSVHSRTVSGFVCRHSAAPPPQGG